MTRTSAPAQQTFTITVTATAGTSRADLYRATTGVDGVLGVDVDADSPDGPNRERLTGLIEWVGGEHVKRMLGLPSQWYQGDWLTRRNGTDCGTACCIAGKVALDDGGVPVYEVYDNDADAWVEVPWDQVAEGRATGRVRFPDGTAVAASDYAQAALGLTDDQARDLFSGSNTYEAIVSQVGKLLAPEVAAAAQAEAGVQAEGRPRRVLRAGRSGDCGEGEGCNICYEDAPAYVPF